MTADHSKDYLDLDSFIKKNSLLRSEINEMNLHSDINKMINLIINNKIVFLVEKNEQKRRLFVQLLFRTIKIINKNMKTEEININDLRDDNLKIASNKSIISSKFGAYISSFFNRGLLFIDNVDDIESIKYIEGISTNNRYLIGSRSENWGSFPVLKISSEMPPEHSLAPAFETVENRIVLRAGTPDTLPDDEQIGLYDALREQAVELWGLCPENSNRYGAQGKAVVLFLAALGDDYSSMRLSALWLAGQKMRRFARADDAKRAAADPDDEPMEPDQSALFAEVVTTYNVFSTGELGLKAKDEKGRDPATLSPDVTKEARAVRGAVAASPALFGDGVEPVLEGMIEEAEDSMPGIAARGVVMERETFENLLGAVLRKARTEPKPDPSEIGKGAKSALGATLTTGALAGAGTTATAFVAYYETTLIAFASKLPNGPVWVSIIQKIAALWPGL